MTEPLTRPTPTPAALAAARATAAAFPMARPAAAGAYDRRRWEHALIKAPLAHRNARLLGFLLAHHAGAAGYLPAGGMQHAARLAEEAGMAAKQARISLWHLEMAGLISRPDITTWQPRDVLRPITLTFPTAGARTEPPSTGELR